MPGQQRRRADREHLSPPPTRDQRGERREPKPVGRLVTDPDDVTTQDRILMPQHQQLSVLDTSRRSKTATELKTRRVARYTRDRNIEPGSQLDHRRPHMPRSQSQSYFRALQVRARERARATATRPAVPADPGRPVSRPPAPSARRGPRSPGHQLFVEIKALGFTGSFNLLYRYITQGRVEADRPHLSS